jgi:hypothetical protein
MKVVADEVYTEKFENRINYECEIKSTVYNTKGTT